MLLNCRTNVSAWLYCQLLFFFFLIVLWLLFFEQWIKLYIFLAVGTHCTVLLVRLHHWMVDCNIDSHDYLLYSSFWTFVCKIGGYTVCQISKNCSAYGGPWSRCRTFVSQTPDQLHPAAQPPNSFSGISLEEAKFQVFLLANWFLSRVSTAMLMSDIDVCPSVCPSICSSRSGIVSRRLNTYSKFLQHTVAQSV